VPRPLRSLARLALNALGVIVLVGVVMAATETALPPGDAASDLLRRPIAFARDIFATGVAPLFCGLIGAVLSAFLGVGWLASLLVQKTPPAPSGLRCRACGYDLRATPERCPECGVVPEK
jgi:hypothetical protein